jgi:O-antigen/teichoic acid export membrane protein
MSDIRHAEAGPDTAAHRGPGSMLARLVGRHGAAAAALGIRLGAAGLAYLLQIVLARSLGSADYGIFSFAWSLVTISGFLATLGFGQIAVRFLAQYHHEGRHGLAQGFLRTGLAATLCGSIAIIIGVLLFRPIIERGYGELCSMILTIGLFCIPFFALTDFMEGIARSQGWTIRALVPPYIVRQGTLLVLLLAALAIGRKTGAEAAMGGAFLATVLAAATQVALLAGKLRQVAPPAQADYAIGTWAEAARPTLLSDLALLARQNTDLMILGLLAPPEVLGHYFAATRVASLLGLIDFAIGAAFGHRFARAAREEVRVSGAPALGGLYYEARRLSGLPGLAAAAILVIAAPFVMELFGPAFTGAVVPAQILLTAGGLKLMTGPAEDALSMAGHPEAVWHANAVAALLMALLCLLLVPEWQAMGAALAAAGGLLGANLMLLRSLRAHLGITPFRRDAA